MSRNRRILIYTVAGAVALTCVGVASAIVLRRAAPPQPVISVRAPASAPATAPARPALHSPAEGTRPHRTPSEIDSAAASRPDWPYASHEGGTPALVAALAAPFAASTANRTTATGGGTTQPGASAIAPSTSNEHGVTAQDANKAAATDQKSSGFKDFWRPKPRGPGARSNTPGGWNSDPRPTSGGNG